MNIQFNNRDPVYVQVVRYFKEQIAIGIFEPGQEIPSRRELANRLKINPNTAQRAYKEMEEEGLIHTEGNLPSKITTNESVLKSIRSELIEEAVDDLIESVMPVRVSLEELLETVSKRYKREEGKDD